MIVLAAKSDGGSAPGTTATATAQLPPGAEAGSSLARSSMRWRRRARTTTREGKRQRAGFGTALTTSKPALALR